MLDCKILSVQGFEPAIHGMRNPKNSWEKSDSQFNIYMEDEEAPDDVVWFYENHVGENDMHLMQTLFKAGTEHRKYDRMIVVWCDITAPLYWWKEFDTYKVGTVANSCSTMHKIQEKEFTMDDFSTDHLIIQNKMFMHMILETLNEARQNFLDTKDKMWWWQMIQMLPSTYNQKRTVMLNYEVIARIVEQRSNHKLDEWHTLVNVFRNELPYIDDIMGK